jgi:hypothetical protein
MIGGWSRYFGDVTVDLSAALIAHIHTLMIDVGDARGVAQTVELLSADLKRAVSSYLGFQLALVEHGHPLTLTVFDSAVQPDLIDASLRLTLSGLGVAGADPASSISFYAGTAGAFVDLAADLGYALRTVSAAAAGQEPSRPHHGEPAISVDSPVQPTTVESGLTGAADLSLINRAIGILIGHGHQPDEAHQVLIRAAATAGVTITVFAARLVGPARDGSV